MKRFLVILLSVMSLVFAGCSKADDEVDFQYEVPVDTLFEALDSKDSTSFLRCFATPVLKSYENSTDYDENIATSYYNEILQMCGFEKISISYKITDKHELSSDEISQLSDGLAPRHNVKKAYRLSLRVTCYNTKSHDETYSQELELISAKLGDNWYICSSPIIEWKMMKNLS